MRFGKVVATHTDPGIKFKAPMLDDLIYYEKRVLNIDPPAENLLLADQKRVLVDAFARYRIADAQLFFQRLRQEEALPPAPKGALGDPQNLRGLRLAQLATMATAINFLERHQSQSL